MPLRMQGVWVSDTELQRLVRYWKGARGIEEALDGQPSDAQPRPPTAATTASPIKQPPLWEDMKAELDKQPSDGEDELFNDAVQVVREMRKASISLLQRRLRIGYTRSARLIDLLEERGIVGPAKAGAQQREVIGYSEEEIITPAGAPGGSAPPPPSGSTRTWEMEEDSPDLV